LRGYDYTCGRHHADEFASAIFNKQPQHRAFHAEIQTNISLIITVLISAHKNSVKRTMVQQLCLACEWPGASEFKFKFVNRNFTQENSET
jgi:hypothetical protein